jgi:hypothetical protein
MPEFVVITAANITGAVAVTLSRISGPSAAISPVPVTPAPGELIKLANVTAAAVGILRLQATATISGLPIESNEIDLVVSAAPAPPPPPPPPPPSDYGWQFSPELDIGSSAQTEAIAYDLTAHVALIPGMVGTYSKLSGPAAVTVSGAGLLSKPVGVTPGDYSVGVRLQAVGPVRAVLTVAGGGAGLPWTAGQVFAEGEVPAGTYVGVEGVTAYQVDVRNRWEDGSVKFAVVSGVGGTSIQIGTTLAPHPTGAVAAVTALDVGDTRLVASGIGTAALADAIAGADLTAFAGTRSVRPTAAGLLRTHAGPVMRESRYYSPLGTHMAVIWTVRKYSTGHIEVETEVENGWHYVTGGAQADYVAQLIVNGSERYNSSTDLAHIGRTTWSRVDWVGTAPGTTPLPDAAALRESRLVPNYGAFGAGPSGALLDSYAAVSAAPFAQGFYPNTMGAAGYSPSIGLLPAWDAVYCTSGDPRAFHAVLAQARNAGRYAMRFRNEATMQVDYNADPEAHVSEGASVMASMTGDAAPTFARTHAPSVGYLAYLLTGRWSMLDTLASSATGLYYRHNWLSRRGGARGLPYFQDEARSHAWQWRTLAQLAAIAPDSSALQSQARARWGHNMQAYGRYWTGDSGHQIPASSGTYLTDHGTAPNNLGCVSSMEADMGDQLWMHMFVSQALGYAWDLQPWADATAKSWHRTMRDKSYDLAAMYQTDPGLCYRFGTVYRPFWGSAPRVWWPSWRAWADSYLGGNTQWLAERTAAPGGPLYSVGGELAVTAGQTFEPVSTSSFFSGYVANAQPAIAYAAEHGHPLGVSAWGNLSGSSSYVAGSPNYANAPHFGVVPRA